RYLPVRDQEIAGFDIELRLGPDLIPAQDFACDNPAPVSLGGYKLIGFSIDQLCGPLDLVQQIAKAVAAPALRRLTKRRYPRLNAGRVRAGVFRFDFFEGSAHAAPSVPMRCLRHSP